LFEACKIKNRLIANRNQSKLQVIYERVEGESYYHGSDLIKTIFRNKTEKESQLWNEPYANFDQQFYQWLLDNN
jgi:hypothetical protein